MAGHDRQARRIAALQDELRRVQKLVDALDDPTPRGRVRATLSAEIDALEKLVSSLPSSSASPLPPPLPGESTGTESKRPSSADLAAAVQRLAQLALSLHGGFGARAAELDDGMCPVADGLLHEITSLGGPAWELATVPSDADFFSERDRLIRLRWPGEGMWTLPLVLHELGHFVGRRLESSEHLDDDRWAVVRPFEDRLRMTGEEMPADWHHLHELFADAYATYVGGPAYLACCASTALDPTADRRDEKTHPAPSRRLVFAIEILEHMDRSTDNTASLAFEIDEWRSQWAEAVTSAGGSFETDLDESDRELVDFIWATLDERLGMARYRTMNTAMELAGRIRSPSAALDADLGGATATDAMNAAWCARRIDGDAGLPRLEQRSRQLLEAVVSCA